MAGGKGFGRDVIVTDIIHHRGHQGVMFIASTLIEQLSSQASALVLIRVVAGTSAHMRFRGATTDAGLARFFVGPTTTADGTPLVANSRNLFTDFTANTLFFTGPTVTDPGEEKWVSLIPGGSQVGAIVSGFSEWQLPPGDYLLDFKNTGQNNQDASLEMDFYEPPEGRPIV